MVGKEIPYSHQYIDSADIRAVCDTLDHEFITQGEEIEEFEKKVAAYCGAKYGVAVCNGTAALHLACMVAGVKAGYNVITSPLTFAATANAIIFCGGKPIFTDVDSMTMTVDPKEIYQKITPDTVAIMPVDFAGHPCEMDEIMSIAKEYGLVVIEDAAHSLGAKYKDKKVGSLADMTILSFHPVKHITTGEGGMVLTNNESYYEHLKKLRHHGITKKGGYIYEIDELGYNYRITSFQCALGISQMNKLDKFVHIRRDIASIYKQELAGVSFVYTPIDKYEMSYHLFAIRVDTNMLSRDTMYWALKNRGVGVNVHYIPLHLQPYYQNKFRYREGDFPVAERYFKSALSLPIYPSMTSFDIRHVIDSVKEAVEESRI